MDGTDTASDESAAQRATVGRSGRADSTPPQDQSATICELELTILTLRDQLIGSEAKLGELRADLQREQARYARAQELFEIRSAHSANERAIREDLQKQLDDMRTSTTWKIGRALLKPVGVLRSTFRPS